MVLALFAGFALLASDAQARGWGRVRIGHRHHIRHHVRHHVVRPHVHRIYRHPRVYVHPRVYHGGVYVPYRHYQHGFGGVYYHSPGFSLGIQF
jgi:hypothetical protein